MMIMKNILIMFKHRSSKKNYFNELIYEEIKEQSFVSHPFSESEIRHIDPYSTFIKQSEIHPWIPLKSMIVDAKKGCKHIFVDGINVFYEIGGNKLKGDGILGNKCWNYINKGLIPLLITKIEQNIYVGYFSKVYIIFKPFLEDQNEYSYAIKTIVRCLEIKFCYCKTFLEISVFTAFNFLIGPNNGHVKKGFDDKLLWYFVNKFAKENNKHTIITNDKGNDWKFMLGYNVVYSEIMCRLNIIQANARDDDEKLFHEIQDVFSMPTNVTNDKFDSFDFAIFNFSRFINCENKLVFI